MSDIENPPEFEHLPWQQLLWGQLLQAHRDERLHHALLIGGMRGMGKTQLARNLAHFLFCTSPRPQDAPCGSCRGCRLFRAGTHPDFLLLGPDAESKSGEIKIEAIRNLTEQSGLSTSAGGYRVVIVAPAERMNRHAANSLLKTLEEPVSNTLIVLVTDHPGRMLPTIRSRCQQLHLTPPAESDAQDWLSQRTGADDPLLALRLANGAPLAAEALLNSELLKLRNTLLIEFFTLAEGRGDPIKIAESWMKLDLPLLLGWIGGWVADILRLGSRHPAARLTNPDRGGDLGRQAELLDPKALHRFWRRVVEAREQLQSNLNPQLMLESLLAQWSDLRR